MNNEKSCERYRLNDALSDESYPQLTINDSTLAYA